MALARRKTGRFAILAAAKIGKSENFVTPKPLAYPVKASLI
jgi:hypothetical protein